MASAPPSLGSAISPLNLWSSLRSELLWIYEGPVHESNRRRESDHTYGYWVWLLLKGEVRVTSRNGAWRAKPGQWLISPQEVIAQAFSREASILSLHFSCQWPTGDNLFSGRQGTLLEASRYPALEEAARRLLTHVQQRFPSVEVHFAHQPARYSEFLDLQRLFSRWLDAFGAAMECEGRQFMHIGQMDERVMKAVRTLNEAPMDRALPVEILERDTGLGRAHLDRLFYRTLGSAIRAFWDKRRLDSARTLLSTTKMPIKEMAFRLGFKQASHFTKWFLRMNSETPMCYRRLNGR